MTAGIEATPFVGTNDEAEALWFFGEFLAILSPGERTGDGFSVVEHQSRRGFSPPWHRQPADDESFYVIEGEMTFWAGDSERPLQCTGPGSFVFIPRGAPHSFRVDSETARWLSFHTPAGHEGFYRAGGEPAQRRTLPPPSEPDIARVEAAGRDHGVELLGPPPGAPATTAR